MPAPSVHVTLRCFALAVFLPFLGLSSDAQSPAALDFRISGLAEGDTVFLANYYGNKMYYADTAVVQMRGRFNFPSPTADKGGKYGLVLPGGGFVEFIVTGDPVQLEADQSNLPASVVVK